MQQTRHAATGGQRGGWYANLHQRDKVVRKAVDCGGRQLWADASYHLDFNQAGAHAVERHFTCVALPHEDAECVHVVGGALSAGEQLRRAPSERQQRHP